MNLQIPPSLFYAIGTILVIFGALRAYRLGWKQRPAPAPPKAERKGEGEAEDDNLSGEAADVQAWDRGRGGGYKRHITFGLVWVGMGLFLIISTIVQSRG